jgi:hypothetical protein
VTGLDRGSIKPLSGAVEYSGADGLELLRKVKAALSDA